MFKFFHHLLNPHCPDCRMERELIREEANHCQSCETLQLEIARLRNDNERLLDNILNPVKPVERVLAPENLVPITPRHIPWQAKRQQLERDEKLRAAQIRRDAPVADIDIKKEEEELEKELEDVRQKREAQITTG